MAHASELVVRLEATFRMLGKRVYGPSMRRLRTLRPELDKVSLPLLSVLDERGDLRPSDLAAAVDLDLSTVSRHVNQLVRSGFVVRSPDGTDGRAHRVSLTPAGRESLQIVLDARSHLLNDALRDWSDADRAELLTLLTRLLTDVAGQHSSTSENSPPGPDSSPSQMNPTNPTVSEPDQMERTA
jgi:DNA-binding MarR family transcriptional regulator